MIPAGLSVRAVICQGSRGHAQQRNIRSGDMRQRRVMGMAMQDDFRSGPSEEGRNFAVIQQGFAPGDEAALWGMVDHHHPAQSFFSKLLQQSFKPFPLPASNATVSHERGCRDAGINADDRNPVLQTHIRILPRGPAFPLI